MPGSAAHTRIWHTHYLPEEAKAVACFYRRVPTIACLTLIVGLAVLAPPLFTPEPRALRALWALAPLALFYIVHTSLLFVFLVKTPRTRCDVVRMGCTLQLRDTHFRRSTCLSPHPLLHRWYWCAVLLYLPLNVFATVTIAILWLTGALGPITTVLSLLACAASFAYTHNLASRFCTYCIDGAIAHALPTNLDLGRYTTRRAKCMVEQELYLNKQMLSGALPPVLATTVTTTTLETSADRRGGRRHQHRRRR